MPHHCQWNYSKYVAQIGRHSVPVIMTFELCCLSCWHMLLFSVTVWYFSYVLSVSVLYHSFHYGRGIFFLFFSSPLFVHINRSSSISTDLPKLAKANQSVDIIKSFFKKVMCHDDGTTELWSISSHGVQSDSWLSHWAPQPSRNGVFMSAVSPNT